LNDRDAHMPRRGAGRILLVLAALLVSACAHQLVPGAGAQIADGRRNAAVATAAGVTVVADADAWRGFPAGIDDIVTPLLLTIDNQSGRPLRVRLEQFAQGGPGETRLAAHTPNHNDRYVYEPVSALPYGTYGYPLSWPRSYGSYGWGPFGWDPYGWYDPWPPPRSVRLPTTDMVLRALPEAVIDSGVRTRGFVFFDRATRKKGSPLALTMDLVDARSGERFGEIRIPFVVR
jgi:hypothetical protein